MVNLPFVTPEGDSISYNTGQPMGAFSSWPMFALSHHLVVQLAAYRASHKLPFTNYMLLGDDIVLGTGRVAQ
jgi:hypothetical protein